MFNLVSLITYYQADFFDFINQNICSDAFRFILDRCLLLFLQADSALVAVSSTQAIG